MNNKALLLIVGALLCGNAYSQPMLYADYLQALSAPVSSKIKDYINQNTQPERVMNIILSQSQKVNIDSALVFLDSVALLMAHPDYQKYSLMLEQIYIQTLLSNGEIDKGIQAIEQLSSEEQDNYRLLWVVALLLVEKKEQALTVFNDVSEETYRQHQADYIEAAKNMVIDYGISSQAIQLPDDGNQILAQRLIETYEFYAVYEKAFFERERVLGWTSDLIEQQRQRKFLVNFAREHDLIEKELLMMVRYLTIAAKSGEHFYGDVDTVNDYTNSLVRYYSDPRNVNRQKEWSDSLLDAQKLAGQFDLDSHRAYLKNRIVLYQDSRPDFFYTDVVELASVEQDRKLISKIYQPKLSLPIRQGLLEGYFSLLEPSDEKELVMAEAYAELIDHCDEQTPMLVRALKGHQELQESPTFAYQCFGTVDWSVLSLSPQMLTSLQEEQKQVSYMEMKKQKNESEMLLIAQSSTNSDMHLDAALFAAQSLPLTASRLIELEAIAQSLALNEVQQQKLDGMMINTLRQNGDMELLQPFLEKDPSANALELAFLAMEQDEMNEAVHYLMVRLNQPESLSVYEEVKSVRYLDSVYSFLPLDVLSSLQSLPQESVQTMLTLQEAVKDLNDSFEVADMPTMEAVQLGLTEYNQFKSSLPTVSREPNYTANLWLLSELDRRFAQFLTEQADQADKSLQPVLMEQVTLLKSQSQQFLRQLLELKIEGVTDIRIWNSALLLEGED